METDLELELVAFGLQLLGRLCLGLEFLVVNALQFFDFVLGRDSELLKPLSFGCGGFGCSLESDSTQAA